jgi:hypothetical protein
MQNINRVTVYYAQKLSGKSGMGGSLDINGNVSSRRVISLHPVFAQLAIAKAKAKHSDWQVEMVTTTADSAFFDMPKKEAIDKATNELQIYVS